MSKHNKKLELQLVEAIHAGNKESENTLITFYHKDALEKAMQFKDEYSKRHTGFENINDVAQDLLQLMIETLIRKYHDLEEKPNFVTWVQTEWENALNQKIDLDLIDKIRNGNKEAENILFLRYQEYANIRAWKIQSQYSWHYTSKSDIDDIAQNLLNFITKTSLPKYNPKKNPNFVAWVRKGWRKYSVAIPRTSAKSGNGEVKKPTIKTFTSDDESTLNNIFKNECAPKELEPDFLFLEQQILNSISNDTVYLRRKVLAIVAYSNPISIDKHIDNANLRISPKYKRDILKQMAGLGKDNHERR